MQLLLKSVLSNAKNQMISADGSVFPFPYLRFNHIGECANRRTLRSSLTKALIASPGILYFPDPLVDARCMDLFLVMDFLATDNIICPSGYRRHVTAC